MDTDMTLLILVSIRKRLKGMQSSVRIDVYRQRIVLDRAGGVIGRRANKYPLKNYATVI
jgi:hypothetical protein